MGYHENYEKNYKPTACRYAGNIPPMNLSMVQGVCIMCINKNDSQFFYLVFSLIKFDVFHLCIYSLYFKFLHRDIAAQSVEMLLDLIVQFQFYSFCCYLY